MRSSEPKYLPLILGWVLLLFPWNCLAQMQFNEGDWVSYDGCQWVSDVAVGRDCVYLAASGGVLRYHLYHREWADPWVVVRGLDKSIDLRNATNVDYLSETDEVAVLTPSGSYVYNPVAEYWKPQDHQYDEPKTITIADAIFLEPPSSLLSGRAFFKQGDNLLMDRDLKKYSLGAYAEDTFGYQWIAVRGVGVMQYDTRSKRGIIWEMGLYGNDVHALTRGQDWTLSAGHNRNGGVTFWKKDENVWDHLTSPTNSGLESNWINDLATTGRWALAATDYGLAQIDVKNGNCRSWKTFDGLWSNTTTSVVAVRDTVWVGTDAGIGQLFLPKGPILRIEDQSIVNKPITRLAIDPDAIWVGGDFGLYRLDRKKGGGGYLDLSSGVGGGVYALHSTPTELWVGRTNGIEVVQKKDLKQTGWTAQAYFDGAQVNAILAVDSLVWIGTNRGLYKFDRVRGRWHGFTKDDGLIDNRVNAILLDGDYLLLGTSAGITRFYWNDPGRVD
jgi:hypothetical protein